MPTGGAIGHRSPSKCAIRSDTNVTLKPAGWVAIVLSLYGSLARAHEIRTTRVSVLLHDDRTYAIEIVTDAAALFEKLEASGGRPFGPARDLDRQQAWL